MPACVLLTERCGLIELLCPSTAPLTGLSVADLSSLRASRFVCPFRIFETGREEIGGSRGKVSGKPRTPISALLEVSRTSERCQFQKPWPLRHAFPVFNSDSRVFAINGGRFCSIGRAAVASQTTPGVRLALARLKSPSALRRFLDGQANAGLILMAMAALALVLDNSPLAPDYEAILRFHVGPLSLAHWINDALMAAFFLLVGLEIKREMLDGQLASWPRRLLPGIATLGGMLVPALLFFGLNSGETARGWAIPTATDIAFGSRCSAPVFRHR